MASLYLTEYGDAMRGHIGVAQGPAIKAQKLTIGSEVKSTAFTENTRIIRVHVDAICSVLIGPVIGTAPLAAVTDARMAADTTEYFGVNAGEKLSVITNT
jgi:hypothetical protein